MRTRSPFEDRLRLEPDSFAKPFEEFGLQIVKTCDSNIVRFDVWVYI